MCDDRTAPLAGAASVTDVVKTMLALASQLSSDATREDLQLLSPDQRGWLLKALQRLGDATALATATVVEVFDASGDGEMLTGASSTQAWIRHSCRVSGAEAAERVRVARAGRDRLGVAWKAVGAGEITYDHLCAIERGTRRIAPEHQGAAVDLLTSLAGEATVDDVRVAGRHLVTVVDPDGVLPEAHRQFERRYLTLSPLLDGMTTVDGLLDPEAAELLASALQPFLTPVGPTDSRTTAQRRADGLTELVRASAAASPPTAACRPELHVTVSGPFAAYRGSGEPVHPVTLDRLACDARLTPLLVDTAGTVTDLGRTQRLFSRAQRRLLAARDGGCRWPGCHRPPAHTDLHHLVPWQSGGATDVANAVMLCRFHHRLVHEGGWVARAVDHGRGSAGVVRLAGPLGVVLESHPRGPLPFLPRGPTGSGP